MTSDPVPGNLPGTRIQSLSTSLAEVCSSRCRQFSFYKIHFMRQRTILFRVKWMGRTSFELRCRARGNMWEIFRIAKLTFMTYHRDEFQIFSMRRPKMVMVGSGG